MVRAIRLALGGYQRTVPERWVAGRCYDITYRLPCRALLSVRCWRLYVRLANLARPLPLFNIWAKPAPYLPPYTLQSDAAGRESAAARLYVISIVLALVRW